MKKKMNSFTKLMLEEFFVITIGIAVGISAKAEEISITSESIAIEETSVVADPEIEIQSEAAASTEARVTNVTSHLNLRSGSGTKYEIIGKLSPGEEVKVVGEDGNWYEVVIPEKTGFVYKDYIELLKEKEAGSAVDEELLSMLLYLMASSMNQKDQPALTPDGNLTLVDDIGSSTEAGQQFITLVTKNGNFFYLIIDRNDKGEENVHFMNLVDEADLFALMEEEEAESVKAVLEEESMEKEAEKQSEAESEIPNTIADNKEKKTEPDSSQSKSNRLKLAAVGIAALLALGGGYFVLQKRKKQQEKAKVDPDAAYEEEEMEEIVIPVEEDVVEEKEKDEAEEES